VLGATTGTWFIVKWVGIAIFALYLVLIAVTILRFRRRLSRLRNGFYLPIIIGNFVWLGLPLIFENVIVTRVCFVVAQALYIGGIAILMRCLVQKGQEPLGGLTGES
jgi:hypothetical protein